MIYGQLRAIVRVLIEKGNRIAALLSHLSFTKQSVLNRVNS